MKYFKNCETLEDVKKQYRELVFKYHPDKGGDTATMQEVNAEYEKAFELYKNTHRNAKGETYNKETDETPEVFRDILNKIIHIPSIDIEICGAWIWVTGDTKPHKEYLKENKFRWSKNKSAWYWHNEPYRKKSKKQYTLDEIREKFGSDEVEKKEHEKLQAGA